MKQSTPEKIASGAIRLGPAMTFLVAVFLAWNNTVVVADEKTDALRDHVPRLGTFPPSLLLRRCLRDRLKSPLLLPRPR